MHSLSKRVEELDGVEKMSKKTNNQAYIKMSNEQYIAGLREKASDNKFYLRLTALICTTIIAIILTIGVFFGKGTLIGTGIVVGIILFIALMIWMSGQGTEI